MEDRKSYDKEEILRALNLMVKPGQTVELRLPKGKGLTELGYFTDLNKLAQAAEIGRAHV